MARKRKNDGGKLGDAAEELGRVLGTAAGRASALQKQRAAITKQLNQIIGKAEELLDEVKKLEEPIRGKRRRGVASRVRGLLARKK